MKATNHIQVSLDATIRLQEYLNLAEYMASFFDSNGLKSTVTTEARDISFSISSGVRQLANDLQRLLTFNLSSNDFIDYNYNDLMCQFSEELDRQPKEVSDYIISARTRWRNYSIYHCEKNNVPDEEFVAYYRALSDLFLKPRKEIKRLLNTKVGEHTELDLFILKRIKEEAK